MVPCLDQTLTFTAECVGEGDGNPLQCSWLENPRDGGAWWAAVYGVAQSRTRLKRLSSSSSRMSMFTLVICLITSNLPWFMDLTFQVPMLYCSYSIRPCFYHQSHLQLGVVFVLAPSLHSFWSYFSLISSSILGTYRPGEFIFQCPIFFAFSYCSWGSQGKNTEVVCHSLLQWTTFCQVNSGLNLNFF